MSCWWSLYREWYFTLSTLGTPYPKPKGPTVYRSGSMAFRESDIAGQFDEAEEQLYAVRHNLA